MCFNEVGINRRYIEDLPVVDTWGISLDAAIVEWKKRIKRSGTLKTLKFRAAYPGRRARIRAKAQMKGRRSRHVRKA